MNFREKIRNIMAECAVLDKDGYNAYHKYPYVTAARVSEAFNAACTKFGIASFTNFDFIDIREVETGAGKKERLTTLKARIELSDTDSDEHHEISGIGQGQDAGDKGAAKAATMAIKYALTKTFLVCDASDDPDSDVGEIVPAAPPRTSGGGGAAAKSNAGGGAAKNNSGGGKAFDKNSSAVVGDCEECGAPVTERNAYYSTKYHNGALLCYECQQARREGAQSPF